ncbi:hypothetical protein ABT354_20040 [Streptomyces sp. NPDC000594]|uniref:hypothetical protein n=1 Tax=Streptomyces sp. NPDC000594 TaxID=3154261 RepID=UPI0033332172
MTSQPDTSPTAGLQFASAVASDLGPQWSPEPSATHPGRYQLTDGGGSHLVLLPGAVRAILPEVHDTYSLKRRPSSPEIGVTPHSPAHVAQHIARRLLPKYETARARLAELVAARDSERRGRAESARRLAYTLSPVAGRATISPDTPMRGQTSVSLALAPSPWVAAVIDAGGASVTLSISGLSTDEAVRVAELVRSMSSRVEELT